MTATKSALERFLDDPASLTTRSDDTFIKIEDICSICREATIEPTVSTSCVHTIHRRCLLRWFQELDRKERNGTCPLCRNVLFEHLLRTEWRITLCAGFSG